MSNDGKTIKVDDGAVTAEGPREGTYYLYVRFERNFHDDCALARVSDETKTLGMGEALRRQLTRELDHDAVERGGSFEVISQPTTFSDPATAFVVKDGLKGRPWTLSEYMKAARHVSQRFRAAWANLGVAEDPALKAAFDRIESTGIDDLVAKGAQEMSDAVDKAEEQYNSLVEKVRTSYSTAQSVVSELEDALPDWAKR